MGSLKSAQEESYRRRWPGKIDAPLDKKLKSVKWGEFRLGDLFEVLSYKKRFDANKVRILESGGHPYIVRMSGDNGQKGFIDEDSKYLNAGNTISFGQDTATMFYQENPYFTGDKIKILVPKEKRFSKKNAQFFLATMRRTFKNFSWGTSSFSIETLKSQSISLPITSTGKIDFAFMESFIRELEEERIRELEEERIRELSAYLAVSGLDNYELSKEEEDALANFFGIKWKKHAITDVFHIENTHSILASDIVPGSGVTPYLCASAENNGVSSFISYDKKYLEHGNCIFIGGKTFVVSYQKQDFYSNDSHNLALRLKDLTPQKENQLFLATCVRKSLGHKYTWGNSISKEKIKRDSVMMPVNYTEIETFMRAVQKLVVRDVSEYTARRIAATKEAVK